jgi:cation:H+ antiporter
MEVILNVESALPLWLRFVVGVALLILGAEGLVRGASRLASRYGVPPLIVGLTIVAFGTSAPELAVSVGASLKGESSVAVGNIVGSNVMNVLLILGLSAIVAPLIVREQLVRIDVPLLIVVSVAVWAMAADGQVSQIEGWVLVIALASYLGFLFISIRRGKSDAAGVVDLPDLPESEVEEASAGGVLRDLAVVAGGMIGLMLGARWLVLGAVAAAEALGVSELVIGLTIVAIGTSLPEVATSVLASIRGERDVAVGNVVGSNLFNLLCVLGITAVLPPLGVPVESAAINFDIPVMVAVAVLCFPIFFTGGRISRWEGGLMLGYFCAYMLFVLLKATEHDALGPASWVMLAFVLPLTGLGLTGAVILSVRNRRERQQRLDELRRLRAVDH